MTNDAAATAPVTPVRKAMYPGHMEHFRALTPSALGAGWVYCNLCMKRVAAILPEVGDGMTERLPDDLYPYVVVDVSASGKTVTLWPIETNGIKAENWVANHTFTDEERAAAYEAWQASSIEQQRRQEKKVRLHKDGRYHMPGSGASMSPWYMATYYRNFAD